MQSPNSDSGQGSPASSSPNSPITNITANQSDMKFQKNDTNMKNRYQDDENYPKDVKQKFNVLLNKENNGLQLQPSQNSNNNGAQPIPTAISRSNLDQILYPKTTDRDLIETSAKFSIERLKQLADQRLSPSNIENNSLTNNKIFSIDHSLKYSNNNNNINSVPSNNNNNNASTIITSTSPTATILSNSDNPIQTHHHIHNHQHAFSNHQHLNILNQNSFNNLKYGINNTNINSNNNNNNNNESSDLDIERIKFARNLTNGKELSDFGFRIQLGGLTTNYAHSETSEELNVDGNEDSSQDGNSVSLKFGVTKKKIKPTEIIF